MLQKDNLGLSMHLKKSGFTINNNSSSNNNSSTVAASSIS